MTAGSRWWRRLRGEEEEEEEEGLFKADAVKREGRGREGGGGGGRGFIDYPERMTDPGGSKRVNYQHQTQTLNLRVR